MLTQFKRELERNRSVKKGWHDISLLLYSAYSLLALRLFYSWGFTFLKIPRCIPHLSSEVSADCGHVVQLSEDLPEDLFIYLSTIPPVECRRGVSFEDYVADNQSETPRGGAHSVRLWGDTWRVLSQTWKTFPENASTWSLWPWLSFLNAETFATLIL